jgi:adenine deaminase
VLGLGERTGAVRPGLAADLVVCDEEFGLDRVMRHGRWLTGSGAQDEPAGSARRADRAGELPG